MFVIHNLFRIHFDIISKWNKFSSSVSGFRCSTFLFNTFHSGLNSISFSIYYVYLSFLSFNVPVCLFPLFVFHFLSPEPLLPLSSFYFSFLLPSLPSSLTLSISLPSFLPHTLSTSLPSFLPHTLSIYFHFIPFLPHHPLYPSPSFLAIHQHPFLSRQSPSPAENPFLARIYQALSPWLPAALRPPRCYADEHDHALYPPENFSQDK